MAVQSKKNSFIESLVNTFIGYIITLLFSPMIYWTCGIAVTGKQLWIVTLCFTVLSVARGYVVRRWFNLIKNK